MFLLFPGFFFGSPIFKKLLELEFISCARHATPPASLAGCRADPCTADLGTLQGELEEAQAQIAVLEQQLAEQEAGEAGEVGTNTAEVAEKETVL